jgi:ArsR family transcriptional regulator
MPAQASRLRGLLCWWCEQLALDPVADRVADAAIDAELIVLAGDHAPCSLRSRRSRLDRVHARREYQCMLIQSPLIDCSEHSAEPQADGAWVPPRRVAELAGALRLLADPRRLVLVHLLAARERCVCEFEDLLGWPQNLISHHLGALRRAGLVSTRREGHWVYYSLVPARLARTREQLAEALGPEELPDAALPGGAIRCDPTPPPPRRRLVQR